jgi:uncharacterized protein YsxB (DUF464 family)
LLEITIFRDEHHLPARISAAGHTGFADRGEDIVCAAASGILQAARLGIERYGAPHVRAQQQSGKLEILIEEPSRSLETLDAIVVTAELAIAEVAARFPEHVRLVRKRISREVGGAPPQRVSSMADQRRPQDV